MPDWAECVLIVAGKKEDVESFVRGLEIDTNGHLQIFNTYVPLPDIFKEIPYSIAYDDTPLTPEQEKSMKDYGFKKGSEFEYQWWGVKWGDQETKLDTVEYGNGNGYARLETRFPWSEPYKGMIALSKKFPKLKFNATYQYETNQEMEAFLYINGERSYGTESEMPVGYDDNAVFEDMMNFDDEESV